MDTGKLLCNALVCLRGKKNREHWSIKRQPWAFSSVHLLGSRPFIRASFMLGYETWRGECDCLWLPSESQLWQIDCERLAWKSFQSEGLCSKFAVYTQTAETKGCPAAWWHHPGQNKCRCPAGLASGSVFDSTAGLSAFLHFPTVLSTKFSSSLPFSVPAPCKMRWTWSSPAPQPPQVHLPSSPCFSSHVAHWEHGSWMRVLMFSVRACLSSSLFGSHFSSVPTLPVSIFCTPHSSPDFLPHSFHLLPPSVSPVGASLLGPFSLYVDICLLSSFLSLASSPCVSSIMFNSSSPG